MIDFRLLIIWQPLHTPAKVSGAVEKWRTVTPAGVEQDRLGPALAGAQHVAVREAAHRDHALEFVEPDAPGNQVAHVHVDRGKAGLVHHPRRLDVRVDALLAQDRHARTHAGVEERRRHVLARVERQHRRDAGIGLVEQAVVFGVGAGRVVAQARDAPAGLAPQAVQGAALLAVDGAGVAREFDHAALVRLADDMAAGAQLVFAQHVHHRALVLVPHLDHRAQFFGEQRAQGQLVAALGHLAGPVLGVAPVGGVLAFHRQDVEVDRHAAAAGKRHLGQRRVQAAVRTVVVGEQLAVAIEPLDRR
jgi:hypothetical protein